MAVVLAFLITVGSSFADSKLPVVKGKIGSHSVVIQVAEKEEDRARGLMFVRKMEDDTGMLFVFDREFIPTFWMKNTLIPLSIAFIDKKFRIVDIQEMVPPKSIMDLEPPRYTSRKPATLALEMNREWFKRHGIKEGNELLIEGPGPTPILARLLREARPKSQ
jgi:uncharacterized membrane protein (UPF0127 family)